MAKNIFQKLYHKDLEKVYKRFDGVILDNVIGEIPDLQQYFEDLSQEIDPDTKILISYHNPFWEPVLTIASKFGYRKKVGQQNWLDRNDLANILNLAGFEVVSSQRRFFGITEITTARIKIADYRLENKSQETINKNQTNNKLQNSINKLHSVSIIVPARNEEGNIAKIIPSIPKFGKWQEVIFVEGHSHDKTWEKIKQITSSKNQTNYKLQNTKIQTLNINPLTIRAFRQKGRGKADAVWLGFEKAKGDILMIYDADRTVDAKDLPKFYNALASGLGEFANGSRMVYPMENAAMQTLNKFGNKLFGNIFTWIFGQKFKDTLCGTKALFRKDYLYMKTHNKKYFKMDPFGDFALIFGAIKNNLKVVEIPVRYKERVYGSTNISRFKHGLILLRMTINAFREFKA